MHAAVVRCRSMLASSTARPRPTASSPSLPSPANHRYGRAVHSVIHGRAAAGMVLVDGSAVGPGLSQSIEKAGKSRDGVSSPGAQMREAVVIGVGVGDRDLGTLSLPRRELRFRFPDPPALFDTCDVPHHLRSRQVFTGRWFLKILQHFLKVCTSCSTQYTVWEPPGPFPLHRRMP
jgi:hypothetical protein